MYLEYHTVVALCYSGLHKKKDTIRILIPM
jgi:hypothetical protein